MKIAVRQIYIRPGVEFPFSYLFQRKLSRELRSLVKTPAKFLSTYGKAFGLVVNISAETGTTRPTIKGPAVFKKTKDVEFTVFLPFDLIHRHKDKCRCAVQQLLEGLEEVFRSIHADTRALKAASARLVDEICADSTMFEAPET